MGNSPKMSPTEAEGNTKIHSSGSWRQAILNRVVTPGKDQDNKEADKPGSVNFNKNNQGTPPRRTKEELRELWRKAINQQVILIRMEKENTRLRGKEICSFHHILHKNNSIGTFLFIDPPQRKKTKKKFLTLTIFK